MEYERGFSEIMTTTLKITIVLILHDAALRVRRMNERETSRNASRPHSLYSFKGGRVISKI
jgi:hypothetical protein